MRAHALLIGSVVVLAASLAVVGAFGFPISALPFVVGPTLILVGLTRVLPPRLARIEPLALLDRPVIAKQLRWILGFVIALILLSIPGSYLIFLQPMLMFPQRAFGSLFTWQHLFAAFVFALLPGILLAYRFRSDGRQLGLRVSGAWRWIGPLTVTGVFTFFVAWSIFGNGLGTTPSTGMIVFAIALAVGGAAIPEELVFRVLLQTRLEALYGRWNGIAATSVLFGVMHAPQTFFLTSAGHVAVWPVAIAYTIAVTILNQGLGGVMFGYIWARYRNFWAQVAIHGAGDTVAFIAIFGGFIKPS
jgi:uncharacterized protein